MPADCPPSPGIFLCLHLSAGNSHGCDLAMRVLTTSIIAEVEARPCRDVHPTFFRLGEIRPAHGFLRILGGLSCVLGAKWSRVWLGQLYTANVWRGGAPAKPGVAAADSAALRPAAASSASSGPPLSVLGGALSTSSASEPLSWPVNWQAQVGRQEGLVMLLSPTLFHDNQEGSSAAFQHVLTMRGQATSSSTRPAHG